MLVNFEIENNCKIIFLVVYFLLIISATLLSYCLFFGYFSKSYVIYLLSFLIWLISAKLSLDYCQGQKKQKLGFNGKNWFKRIDNKLESILLDKPKVILDLNWFLILKLESYYFFLKFDFKSPFFWHKLRCKIYD